MKASPDVPSPVGHGWYRERSSNNEEELQIDWMDGLPAPEAVLKLMSCKCVSACREPNCPCLANGLRCTDMCKLQDCDNQAEDLESDTNDQGVSDDSEDSE